MFRPPLDQVDFEQFVVVEVDVLSSQLFELLSHRGDLLVRLSWFGIKGDFQHDPQDAWRVLVHLELPPLNLRVRFWERLMNRQLQRLKRPRVQIQ